MSFQKGGARRTKMRRGKIPQPCRIHISPENGVVSLMAPFNEDFNKEFLAAIEHKRRQWDGERKLWKTTPEMLTTVIDIAIKHFSKIEGLDEIYASDYDIIGVSPDTPLAVIKATVKALRVYYAPDIAPPEKKQEYTEKLQEIADAYGRIEAEREAE